MEIEYISMAVGLVGIGLFFFGYILGQKSLEKSSSEQYDLSQGVKLSHSEN